MDFVKNRAFYHVLCFFWANQARKDSFFVFWIKKILFGPEKESFKKVQKIEIFQRGKSMVFVKKSTVLSSVFLGKSRQGRSFFCYSG